LFDESNYSLRRGKLPTDGCIIVKKELKARLVTIHQIEEEVDLHLGYNTITMQLMIVWKIEMLKKGS